MLLGTSDERVAGSGVGDVAASGRVLSDLRAVILLAGSVRPNPLRKAVDRFVLELPVDHQKRVMDVWHQQLTDAAVQWGLPRLPVRVIADRTTPLPSNNTWAGRCEVRFEQDPFDFRGTGGLLRDLACQYGPDDYLLIANAVQLMVEPIAALGQSMAGLGADVVLACREDGSPSGLMLVRCGALRLIPDLGFVDLNEQALPMIAKHYDVRVLRHPRVCGLPMRTLSDYLDALRHFHRRAAGKHNVSEPFAEDWCATFGIVETAAEVHPTAVVHDSVVLAGARVEAGALLVRALVAPGGVVAEGDAAINCLVTGSSLFLTRS